jgi:hypothetical protein
LPKHRTTPLAHGQITNHDEITVTLVQPIDSLAFIAVNWPAAPTIATPANYPVVAAAITRLIAESATALARWKAEGR